MIEVGSKIILKTIDAIYEPCFVIKKSPQSITVKYHRGTRKDKKTGEYREDYQVDTIPTRDIVSMSERLT